MMTLINGHQVAYTDEGKGPTLLFIHGFPLNRGCWSRQIDGFKHSNRVIAADLRGFGASEPSSGDVTMKGFAEDLFALCQQLQTGPAIVVGHSMGGYIALAFAKAFPMFLSGLVLVGTRAGGDDEAAAAARRATAKKVQDEGLGSVIEAMSPKMLSATNTDEAMAHAVREFMWSSSSKGVVDALLGMAQRPDERAHIQDIRASTLVVTGADDQIIPPSESEQLAQAIPGAELVVVPRAGHLVAYEQPQAFNAALKAWLDSHQPGHMAWPPAGLHTPPWNAPEGVQP